jgi:group I intron endonuclease
MERRAVASLYVVEHKSSGRCYVGWTAKTVQKRRAEHLMRARTERATRFHRALRKHGEDAFDWVETQTFDTDDEAKQAEIYWIAKLKEFGVGLYNLTEGGEGAQGYRHSEETKEKLRCPKSAEHRAKLSAANKGKSAHFKGHRHSEEAKAKLRAAALRRGPSPLRGRQLSEEVKEKLRRPKSAEHRAKLSAANKGKSSHFKGRKHSEETKEKLREAALRRHEREREACVTSPM